MNERKSLRDPSLVVYVWAWSCVWLLPWEGGRVKKYLVTEEQIQELIRAVQAECNDLEGDNCGIYDIEVRQDRERAEADIRWHVLIPEGSWLTGADLERIYFDAQRTDIYTQIEKEFGKES